MGASLLLATAPAQALDPAGVGPRDPGNGNFPAYYTDTVGTALQLCNDGTGNCLAATNATLAPPDGENFYWMATGTLSGPGIDLSVEFALEAAWFGNQRITFDRLRVRGDVAVPGTYTLTTPWGDLVDMDAGDAATRNVNFTDDLGCVPGPGAPCAFDAAATGAHIGDWLVSTTAPGGYLGDAVTEGPATVGVGGLPADMSITGPAGTAATSDFAVMGKVADPTAVSVPTAVDFGNVRGARTQVVRLKNIGTAPQAVGNVALAGAPTLITVPTANACVAGVNLAVGQTCTVAVRYRPDGRKRSAATLRVAMPGGVQAVRVTAQTAAVASSRSTMRFPARRGGTSSRARRIVVTNTGSIPLQIRGIRLTGRDASSFGKRTGPPRVCARGVRVPVGGQCGIYVAFQPKGFGTKRASLVLRSNALPTRRVIGLTGVGR